MPHSIPFDTLAYTKKLKEAGFTEQQAEAQAEALASVVDENLATKHDIELLRRDIKEMENRIVIRLGAIMIAGFSVLAVLMKVL